MSSNMKDGRLGSPGDAEAGYGLGGRRWALAVLILIPFLIAAADTAILVGRRVEPVPEKAIRLVKESSSPIESFSIQQYLNGTLYHRRDRGAKIQIRGWTAVQDSKSKSQTEVEFAYSEDGTDHVARWIVDVPAHTVTPANQEAAALSWMK